MRLGGACYRERRLSRQTDQHVVFQIRCPRIAPMARFQTVITRARFVYSPYASAEMQGFAQVLADSIRARIQSGQNIYDQAAAPLKSGLPGRRGYPDYKAARHNGVIWAIGVLAGRSVGVIPVGIS